METAIKINGENISLPSEWNELTVQQYLCLKNKKEQFEVLSSLSGISADTCKQIDESLVNLILAPVVEMLDTEIPIVAVTDIEGIEIPNDIGKKEFSRKVNADAAFKKDEGEMFLIKLTAIYLSKGTEDNDITLMEAKMLTMNFVKILSAGNKLFSNYALLCRAEAKIKQPNYEPEELSAGVKEFSKYGIFGVVRSIALRWHCDIDAVFKWSYNRVMLELNISAEESRYERKLHKILNRKK